MQVLTDFFWSIGDLNAFTIWMTAVMVGAIVWFLKEVVGSAGYAIVFAPFLGIGALFANFVMIGSGMSLSGDRDTQTVLALSVGIFLTLLLLLGLSSVFVSISNHLARKSRAGKRARDLAKHGVGQMMPAPVMPTAVADPAE